MKILALIPLWFFLAACASSPDSDSGERSKGMEVSASAGGNTFECPGRNSTCYADVRSMCGERGVEEVRGPGQGQVYTAGRSGSGDDPFARADRQRTYNQSVRLRCKTGLSTSR
ncbi:MAG: hypothetical protein IIB77_02660 [Proteobacteria bacterium]|nr:hypothetical protein [Pseudomonadota bacterium]